MRYNKQELFALATQASPLFDREGVLVVTERQDGFFRRTETSLMRWFRLRGNLLFYLRGMEPWTEPLGLLVLEQCSVRGQPQDENGYWPFQIVWEGGLCYKMAAFSEAEQAAWLQSVQFASYECMKVQMLELQQRLESKKGVNPDMNIHMWRIQKGITMDINEVPMCELSLSCDNLLCDADGRPPSPYIAVHVQASDTPSSHWIRYAATEVITTCSNPSFSRTISFRESDGLRGDTIVRLTVHDMRELISGTAVPMGCATLLLSTIQDTQRLRIALSRDNRTVGFITLNGWSLEPSTTSTSPKHTNQPNHVEIPPKSFSHRRSHSLPPRLGVKLKLPSHGSLLRQNYANVYQTTYRFHSGLGGDITVHEVMAEPKICFQLPQQLLGIFIQREKELLQEVICMGEVGGEWKCRQMELLDTHLSQLKHYSHARQSLQAFTHTSSHKYFKQSSRKDDPNLEFAPVNLHLQRMWVQNDTLSKSGFYDTITVGAFTAHNQRAGRNGGLLGLVQKMKEISTSSQCMSSASASRVQMACDAVQAIKHLRGEIVHIMRKLMALAKLKQSQGMMPLAEEMMSKTRTLLTLWDSGLVEEALSFIDAHKVPAQPVSSDLQGNPLRRPKMLSPFKQLEDQLSLLDLKSPSLEDFATPSTPSDPAWPLCNFGKISSSVPEVLTKPPTNKTNFSQELNPIKFKDDHFENEANAYAKLDKFQSLQFHSNDMDHSQSSPIDQPLPNCNEGSSHPGAFKTSRAAASASCRWAVTQDAPDSLPDKTASSEQGESLLFQMSLEENGNMEGEQTPPPLEEDPTTRIPSDPGPQKYLDLVSMSSSPSANYYQPSDEPEPWDLTQLNIEASVMCLVSKIKFLCGRCGSPAVRLRAQRSSQPMIFERSFTKPRLHSSNRASLPDTTCEQRSDRETTGNREEDDDISEEQVEVADSLQKAVKKGNKFTDGLKLSEVSEWSSELRPPMRKLRQAMDGLLKSGRLAHAVLRLTCEPAQRTRAHAALQIRRDTCLSQALTSLVSGLQCWLWSTDPDILVPLIKSGLGPLCGFEGLLSLYMSEKAMWGDMVVAVEDLQTVQFTLYRTHHSTNATPQVTGCRGSLNVLLPVPESLYARFQTKQNVTFTVTCVFFNVGINEKASIWEAFGDTKAQQQSNCDNYERLNIYYHKYSKIFAIQPNRASSSRSIPLEDVMENLRIAVQKKLSKNVEVLHLAAAATRLMNGVRSTSCKSAKDRTGMSCTLEQCQILTSEYHMAEHEFNKALDCMRSEGCRRENTYKNIGIRKYAFTKLQVMALPKQYRPPAGTYGSTQT